VLRDAWTGYRLRWRRRRYLWRAFAARRALAPVADRTGAIRPGMILGFACLRDEGPRLPWFLDHHRRLGVGHFLVVDNGSTDGGREFLAAQGDVSLWATDASYRDARFGMDWINGLLMRLGAGHWCLTVDADETLLLPSDRGLRDLTAWLDGRGARVMPAMMVEMFPEGRLGGADVAPGTDPFATLSWFDPDGYAAVERPLMRATVVRGGPRARVFLAGRPDRAPTLNKFPLVRWDRGFAYANGTHTLLPRRLNAAWADPRLPRAGLLHAKFTAPVVARAQVEKARRAHFADPDAFADYYDALSADPVLWHPGARRMTSWHDLAAAGLVGPGDWT
jgi:hypothetical protein